MPNRWEVTRPKEEPARAIPGSPEFVDLYTYYWDCQVCGGVSVQNDSMPPEMWEPDPANEGGEPGEIVDSGDWLLDQALIRRIRILTSRYVDENDIESIVGKPSLLDHEGVHPAPWGAVTGATDDPAGMRRALALLRHARALTPEARAVCDLVEWAVRWTALTYQCLDAASEQQPSLREKLDESYSRPGTIAVAPILGSGNLGLSGRMLAALDSPLSDVSAEYELRDRFQSWQPPISPDCASLIERIHLAAELSADLDLLYGADTESDYRGDIDRLANGAARWADLVERDLEA